MTRFCRTNSAGVAMIRDARVAIVSTVARSITVVIRGMDANIPSLAALGIHGCARCEPHGTGVQAFFPGARKATLIAALSETFDVVLTEHDFAAYHRELEFVCALIEWGCGPLPTYGEIDAYDRGLSEGRALATVEHRATIAAELAEARRAVARETELMRGELAQLRESTARQRAELSARRTDDGGLARAERQRDADVRAIDALRASWVASTPEAIDGPSERARARALARIEAADLILITLREAEVSR